jgi:hypothetical protein
MTSLSESIERARTAPWRELANWYVTNGEAVVGPVNTSLLLRGIAQGRVERECYVAQHSWSNWREQNYIREIRSLRRWQFSQKKQPDIEPIKAALRAPRFDGTPLETVEHDDTLLGKALELAVRATRASVGVLHRPRPPHIGLVTSYAFGPGMGLSLGEVVPWHDGARVVAGADKALLGEPTRDDWARSSARRLSSGVHSRVTGVAVVSVDICGVRGLLELGRYDHEFRQTDVAVLEDLSLSVNARLQQIAA